MTSNMFIKIVGAIFTILSVIITAYVLPTIRASITEKDMDTLMYYLSLAVKCADQIYTKEQWHEKKVYVKQYIIKVIDEKLHIKLTDEDIETLIEGMVNEIHNNGVKEVIE